MECIPSLSVVIFDWRENDLENLSKEVGFRLSDKVQLLAIEYFSTIRG